MVWIIGEYAERIDNADELLEGFLEGFQDENTQVSIFIDFKMSQSPTTECFNSLVIQISCLIEMLQLYTSIFLSNNNFYRFSCSCWLLLWSSSWKDQLILKNLSNKCSALPLRYPW